MAAAVRPVATGRPGTQVIPDGWAAAHGAAVAGTMTATVDLRLPGSTTEWSEEQQQTVSAPLAPYGTDVPARIQAVTSGATAVEAAGETLTVRGYLIGMPSTVTTIAPEHLVRVKTCDDASLVGRDLSVTDVLRGSLIWERDVFAALND